MHGVRRAIILLPLLAGLLGSAQAAGQDAPRDAQQAFRAEVQKAYTLAEAKQYDDACAQMRPLSRRPVLATFPDRERASLLADMGFVFLACDRPREAYDALKVAAELRPTRWRLLTLAEAGERAGKPKEAAAALIALAQRWPETLDTEVAWQAWRVFQALENDRDTRIQLYQTLLDAGISGAVRDASEMRYELALLYVEAGDVERARAVIPPIVGAGPIVRMRSDRRFDAVIARDTPAMDPVVQARALVDSVQRHALANPRDVQPWIHLAQARLTAGDNTDVIADASRVLDGVAQAAGQSNAGDTWKNASDVVWILNYRAIAHARLGNIDAAIADLQQAATIPESIGGNVGQVINLGFLYCFLGRPDAAVERVNGPMGQMTPHGRTLRALVLLCAASQRGDRGEMKRMERVIRQTATDPTLVIDAHLWAGDVPAAERVLLRMLANPEDRPDALQYATPSRRTPGMPGRARFDDNRDALLARPAVKAAIDKVGRVEPVDLYLGVGFE